MASRLSLGRVPARPPAGQSALGDHVPYLLATAFLPTMTRWQLARLAERAIDLLDVIDGDPDEANGDELDGGIDDETPAFDQPELFRSGYDSPGDRDDAETTAPEWNGYAIDYEGAARAGDDSEDDDPKEEDDHSGDTLDEHGEAEDF